MAIQSGRILVGAVDRIVCNSANYWAAMLSDPGQHHRGNDLACVASLRRLERLDHIHHHRQVVNFGISTTMWDRLFGTFQPTNEPATDHAFWSTIRS